MNKGLLLSLSLGLVLSVSAPMDHLGFNHAAEAQSLSNACKRVYAQYRSKRGPKAFAVTSGGGCGSAWGQGSLAQSQNVAMNNCRRRGSGCRVVESSF